MSDPVTAGLLAAATLGVSVASASSQAKAAKDRAAAEHEAAMREMRLKHERSEIIQTQINEDAVDAARDRVDQANRELSTADTMIEELGISSSSAGRLSTQITYNEGLDLSRTDRQRERGIEAEQFNKRVAHLGAVNRSRIAFNEAKSTVNQANMDVFQSIINFGSSMNKQ